MNLKLTNPVFLCGMMGSGKSTIGRLLAEELHTSFHDLDELIETETGTSIPEIFEHRGEEAFRTIERELLLSHSHNTEGILALGGGALQSQELTDYVKKLGLLIFLDAPADVLLSRLLGTEGRPMIQSEDEQFQEKKIRTLLDHRRPLYSQAHITIKTGNMEPKEIVRIIIQQLKLNNA